MKKITEKIEEKLGERGIIKRIVDKLSSSELNSFYLELLREQSKSKKPTDILREFKENRFTVPSAIDITGYKEYETEWLKAAESKGFRPIQLSPLTPLGSSSTMGYVNQNNVVSAARGTEVVSDATNVLALKIAGEYKSDKSKKTLRYSTVHRHTRAQYITNPLYSAHFGAFCMVSGGLDRGNFLFETEELKNHLKFYLRLLMKDFNSELTVKFYSKTTREDVKQKLINSLKEITDPVKLIINAFDGTEDYYETVRIKIFVDHDKQEIDLADMGLVNWTQKLLNNKKQRLLISGAGLELIYKIKSKLMLTV